MKHTSKLLIAIFAISNACHIYAKTCDTTEKREQVLTKIGYSPTDSSMKILSRYCNYEDWVKEQTTNPYLYQDDIINKRLSKFITEPLNNFQMGLEIDQQNDPKKHSKMIEEMFERRFLYAVYSENRLREMMVWFWFNHFNVYGDSGDFRYIKSYEQIFRNHAFGDFKTMLLEVAQHPAMLIYLDNDLNTKPMKLDGKDIGYNDNYAREFLELHTMGVDGGYTEEDIAALAKILTGFKSVDKLDYFSDVGAYKKELKKIKTKEQLQKFFNTHKEFKVSKIFDSYSYFSDEAHDNSTKQFLGHKIIGNNEKEIEQVIEILAKHPKTAENLSKKMALYFLGKEGSESLIKLMSSAFLENNSNIKYPIDILLTSEEFKNTLHKRNTFKNPYEFYISTVKLNLNGKPINNPKTSIFINERLKDVSFGTHWKLTPEGYSLHNEKYLSPNILHHYINFIYLIIHDPTRAIGRNDLNSYYKIEKKKYTDFLTSKEWLYR